VAAMITEWEKIRKMIGNNEIDAVVQYCRKIETKEYLIIEQKLIDELTSTENCMVRNTIAIILSDLECNKAVETIVSLIEKPENSNCRATLVYALEQLNCNGILQRIFKFLFEGNYETKGNMYSLLESKVDLMNANEFDYCVNTLNQKIAEYENSLDHLYDVKENIFKIINNKL
jgi:hypothetical protein